MKGNFEMKNKNLKKSIMIIVSLAVMTLGVACTSAGTVGEVQAGETPVAQVSSTAVSEPVAVEPAFVSDGVLTKAEVEGLLYMREEEKLAGDVYRYFYEMYGNPVFQNIASSEDAHANSVLNLLTRYDIADPAVAEPGVFTNPDLQALYDQLIAQGSQSLQDALPVGAAIEEIDILDIEDRIAQTDKADIQLVYQNLIAGSENHLRAFVRVLGNKSSVVYVPQYISQERYDEIMQGEIGAGPSGNGQVGKGGGRRWNP
jgi:hypothetical protein